MPVRLITDPTYTLVSLDFTRTNVGKAIPRLPELSGPDVARHLDGIECLFFDGHVKWQKPAQVAETHFWTRAKVGNSP